MSKRLIDYVGLWAVYMRRAEILIVEDNPNVRRINKEHFEKQGYEVTTAGSLDEARAALAAYPPDLILLDVMLPDGSGYDFCREVRDVTIAPIIYLTCMDSDENEKAGFLSGGNDYITKPYDLDVLTLRIAARLRDREIGGPGWMELPPLSLDIKKNVATLNGEVFPLSQKEFQLLAFFVSHAGRKFSPEELYESIWGRPANDSAHNVVTLIYRLRKKLGLKDGGVFEIRRDNDNRYSFLKIKYESEW